MILFLCRGFCFWNKSNIFWIKVRVVDSFRFSANWSCLPIILYFYNFWKIMFICESAFSCQVPEKGLYGIWKCAPQRPCSASAAYSTPLFWRLSESNDKFEEWSFRVFEQRTLKILSCYCNAYYAQHTIWLNSVTQIQMPLPHILCPCSHLWVNKRFKG